MASLDAYSNLVAQATIVELEGIKSLVGGPLVCCLAVSSVDLEETVVSNVIQLSVLKDDLQMRVGQQKEK